jgi:hypothetical protein
MSAAGFDDHDAATYARISLTQAIASAESEVNTTLASYMEADPRDPTGRTFRVKPEMLRTDLASRVALSTSFNLDEQFERTVDLFVAGLDEQLRRRRSRS